MTLSLTLAIAVSEHLADLPLNCPRCGQRLRFSYVTSKDGRKIDVSAATDRDIHMYECWQHERFQFSRDIPLKPTV
jgi:hypothetical protein